MSKAHFLGKQNEKATNRRSIVNNLYLLHFNEPLAHAQHYLGSSDYVLQRLRSHLNCTSNARIIEVIHERGIEIQLAAIWQPSQGDSARAIESKLKKSTKGISPYCPICNPLRYRMPCGCLLLPTSHISSILEGFES